MIQLTLRDIAKVRCRKYCSLDGKIHAHHGRIYFGTEKVQKFETPYDVMRNTSMQTQ
jgi:hypothetical protein